MTMSDEYDDEYDDDDDMLVQPDISLEDQIKNLANDGPVKGLSRFLNCSLAPTLRVG